MDILLNEQPLPWTLTTAREQLLPGHVEDIRAEAGHMPGDGEDDFADIPVHVSEEGDIEEDGVATPRGDENSGGAEA
eukprot:2342800-Alexandrium_andersonii.AAC.1